MFYLLPLMIVLTFLIGTLIVGLYSNKQTTTLKEYAIGHKNFTIATLVATMVATSYGSGKFIRIIEPIYSKGLYWIIHILLVAIISIWILNLLVNRMGPFMGNLSMAEMIGQVYGNTPRVIAAVVCIGCMVYTLAIQIQVTSQILSICINGLDTKKLSILATLIVILYSSIGGIRSVAMTDVFQFFTFFIMIPCCAWLMFQKANKPFLDMFTFLKSFKEFEFNNLCQWNKTLIDKILITLNFLASHIYPSYIHRVYMASNVIQGRKVLLISGIVNVFISSVLLLTGVFIFIGDPCLPKGYILHYIAGDLLPAFKGFFCY